MKLDFLRKKYPKFIYRSYDYEISGENLKISFLFEIPPALVFRPRLVIKNVNEIGSDPVSLKNLIFHVGLMEMLSYWKSTCSPEIIIEAGCLNKEQIKWWKNLIIKGMGQFFYENKIDWRKQNFLKITSLQRTDLCKTYRGLSSVKLRDRYLVPMGGGRDSIVTLEKILTGKRKKEVNCLTVNPTEAAKKVLKVADIKNPIIVKRTIDKRLLELNKEGYLNGHTPFTALLSFLSVLCSALFNYKNIAFSNEKSANEGNVKYLGKIINHQWAKSSEFEKMFKYYCQKYLIKNINYFSYLRSYGELEISKMFIRYPQYFPVFSSCNVGTKIGKRWCGKCPKCLFVYMSLYPHLRKKQMIEIFGKDLFENRKLLPAMQDLMGGTRLRQGFGGQRRHKPFECVGTYQESRKAALLSLRKAEKSGKMPYLLKKFNALR